MRGVLAQCNVGMACTGRLVISPTALNRFRAWFAVTFILASLAMGAPAPLEAGQIKVRVIGLSSAEGNVYASVYDTPEEFPKPDGGIEELQVQATPDGAEITFSVSKPGTYAE